MQLDASNVAVCQNGTPHLRNAKLRKIAIFTNFKNAKRLFQRLHPTIERRYLKRTTNLLELFILKLYLFKSGSEFGTQFNNQHLNNLISEYFCVLGLGGQIVIVSSENNQGPFGGRIIIFLLVKQSALVYCLMSINCIFNVS